jgi:hypothetical protein
LAEGVSAGETLGVGERVTEFPILLVVQAAKRIPVSPARNTKMVSERMRGVIALPPSQKIGFMRNTPFGWLRFPVGLERTT